MDNIFEKHINNTERKFKRYTSMILKSKYDRIITEELIKTYIEARYYNYEINKKTRIFYRRIYEALKKKSEKLKTKFKDKKEIVENTLDLFQYYFYFDYVRNNKSIQEIIEAIDEKRKDRFNLRSADTDNFIFDFMELVVNDIEDIEATIEKYSSSDFELRFRKIDQNNKNYFRAELDYNFSFPEIFSREIIDYTFNMDIIAEDKLFVEYPMIGIEVLKDILDGNFNKIYIVDFNVELLHKKKKLNQLLEILNNQAAQDKIHFEITYDEFKENKSSLFELIKKGFKFALKTNDNMPELTNEEIKILEIFECILVAPKDVNKKKYNKKKILEM